MRVRWKFLSEPTSPAASRGYEVVEDGLHELADEVLGKLWVLLRELLPLVGFDQRTVDGSVAVFDRATGPLRSATQFRAAAN